MSTVAVRSLRRGDAAYFPEEERKQGWHASPDKLLTRLEDEAAGLCASFVAEVDGEGAGYVFVYPRPNAGAFEGKGIPEIVDLAVLEKFRRRGVASRLLDEAERYAAELSDAVCLGVGLHAGYGAAQRLYALRGYVPDGTGVWFLDKPAEPYAPLSNDDDLILYLSKKLR